MSVSVIVPVYNAEEYLHRCINSILIQTYTDFELILVNDGSNDNSLKICYEFEKNDDRIKVFDKENGGVSSARNFGIEEAHNDYICFVDSDDYISENYLEVLIDTKEKYNTYDNIWCGFHTVNYDNSCKNIILASKEENISLFDYSQIMTLYEKWLIQMPWNKLYSRYRIINNKLRFDEKLSLGEDIVFNLNYLASTNGKIAIINKPLNFYLCGREDSLDNSFYSDLLGINNTVFDCIGHYMIVWKSDDKQFKKYYNAYFYGYENVLRNSFNAKSKIKHKYLYNRRIMNSKEFKEVFSKTTCYIHPMFRLAYKTKDYLLIRILEKYLSIKK